MMSSFVPIQGYEKLYLIDKSGNIFSIKSKRILRQYINIGGYRHVYLYSQDGSYKRQNPLTHKLLAQAFLPNPNNHKVVNHKDGNKQNNNLNNLEWCTKSHDVRHAGSMGLKTYKNGERLYNAKLSKKKVIYIRSKKGIVSQRRLAEKFGVSQATLAAAQIGKTWKHV